MTETATDTHLDATSEISLETIKKRAVRGIVILTGRTLVLNFISFISQLLLWAFIKPEEYGVFLLVSAAINFLSYFADIGLGAALIQKKEKPEESDYKTVFFVQEMLVLTVVIIVFIASPFFVRTHSLAPEARNLLLALNISFFLASLKNIPSIILERKLEFSKFVIPQVLENLVYSAALVYFAYKGLGITSFTYAVLLRGVIGVIAIYALQPWKPGIGFSKGSFRSLVKYGIPYQLNNFLATIKDDGITIVLGGILGSFGLGILGTAQKLSQYPLRFFMDNVNKVTFPAFSRMQDDRDHLTRSLTRSIFFISVLTFPSLVGLAVLFPVLIEAIPKYQKWEPAYVPLLLLCFNSIVAAPTTQLTNLLASIGKIKVDLKLMVMWTALTWLFVPILSKNYGVMGAAIGYTVVGSSSVVAFLIVKKVLKGWSITDSVLKPLFASLVMGLVLYLLRGFFEPYNLLKFALLVFVGIATYASLLTFFVGTSLTHDVKKVYTEFIKRQK